MKKNIFLVISYLLLCSQTYGQSWSIGYPIETDVNATLSGDVLTISGTGAMKDYIYGSSYAPWLSSYQSQITQVVIENGVTNIGNAVFNNCSALTSITIPESVKSIGDLAFAHTKLTSLFIPKQVTAISSNAFSNINTHTAITVDVSNLQFSSSSGVLYDKNQETLILYPEGKTAISFTIPNTVKYIGDNAFIKCGITSIHIPESVTSIGDNAFRDCTGLTSVIIPNSVTSIGSEAFGVCTNLTSVTLSNKITKIEYGTFAWCYKLNSITIPEGVRNITDNAFLNCYDLTSINIPNTVTNIGNSAFNNCNKLAYVSMSNNVDSIGSYAFYGCVITSISIPESTTRIGSSAFANCNNLATILFGDNISHIGSGAFSDTDWFNNQPNGIIYIGDILYTYKGTMPQDTTINIKSGTESICGSAFAAQPLSSIVIPNSVTGIGEAAFMECLNLSAVINFNPIPQDLSKNIFTFNSFGETKTLYVPTGSKTDYQGAVEWQSFKIKELPDISLDSISVTPTEKSVTIEWPSYENADGYRIIIYSDVAQTDTISIFEFDSIGNVTNTISSFRSTSTNFSHNITNLESGTDYYYTLEIQGINHIVLKSISDNFTTSVSANIESPTKQSIETSIIGYYTILGEKLAKEPKKGFYITLYSNGKGLKKIRK